ncbi:MAG: DNA repair protein RadC [Chloroflexi bacterium]|nr:DNA repair protein RadC [Chloroflexota bacterium]
MNGQLAFAYHQPPRRRICDLPAEERPLYRLRRHGTEALATTELLALILGTADAPSLADELLGCFGSLHQLARASTEQLMKIRGIGEAQAGRLVATLELSRRLQEPPADERPQVTNPAAAARLLMHRMGYLEQEELWVVLLDTRNRVMKIAEIYKGSLNASVVRIGELFRPAIEMAASAIIVAHNHPSSDPSPSPEDIHVTRQIVQAGKLLDIELLDHLIVTAYSYVSLKERGLGFD